MIFRPRRFADQVGDPSGRGRAREWSQFPSKGARSAWRPWFGRATMFSGRTRRDAVSAKNQECFGVVRALVF